LGEVATIEDITGYGIGALNVEKPQGKFLAALYMIARRRNGEPTFTFNKALSVEMLEAQAYLGIEDDTDEPEGADEITAARAEGGGRDHRWEGRLGRAERRRRRAELKAQVIVGVGWIPAAEYDALTITELNAIIAEINRQRRTTR